MQIIRDISAIKPEPCVATIGFFEECMQDIAI